MLTYSFTSDGKERLYEQLYNFIKNDILSGVLPAGYKLPSKRAFAKNLNISTITIENAYSQLIAEGYIYSLPKRGYYVSEITEIFSEKAIQNTINSTTYSKQHEGVKSNNAKDDNNSDHINTSKYYTNSIDCINLSNNHTNPDNFPFTIWAKLMRETLSDNRGKLMTSAPGAGLPELRQAIAMHLKAYRGMDVSPEQIIIGAGTEYLYNIIIQLLGRNYVYSVEDPGYKKISLIYKSNEVSCKYIPMENNGINTEKLEESNADVIHISPSHHFPTGIVTPISKRYELLNWAAKETSTKRYIIEDDYDSEFRLMGKPIPSLQSIDNIECVIYMNSFSKSLSSTIRISYMVLPPHLMKRYNKTLSFYACTVSNFEQYTLASFINGGYFEKHINRMRNYYRMLRDKFIELINNSKLSKACTISEEDSGLHFLINLDTKLTDYELKKTVLSHNVLISCVSDYYHEQANAKQHTIIVNYSGLYQEQLPIIISALEVAIA